MNPTRSIGHLIIDEIIKQRMFRAEFDGHAYLFIWQGSSAEQLEALVESHYVKKWPTEIEGEWIGPVENNAHNIIAALKNRDALSQLSHRELIDKVMGCDAGDYDVVIELCNRLLPGWEK